MTAFAPSVLPGGCPPASAAGRFGNACAIAARRHEAEQRDCPSHSGEDNDKDWSNAAPWAAYSFQVQTAAEPAPARESGAGSGKVAGSASHTEGLDAGVGFGQVSGEASPDPTPGAAARLGAPLPLPLLEPGFASEGLSGSGVDQSTANEADREPNPQANAKVGPTELELEPIGAPEPDAAAQAGGAVRGRLAFAVKLVEEANAGARPASPEQAAKETSPGKLAPSRNAVPGPNAGPVAEEASVVSPAGSAQSGSAAGGQSDTQDSTPAKEEEGKGRAAAADRSAASHAGQRTDLAGMPGASTASPRDSKASQLQAVAADRQVREIAAPEAPQRSAAPREPARDITLEVNRDGRRVEVRLTDQGGELKVAVRTPDARLAGDLRRDLPSLASQLEQTGFHAESLQTETPRRHEHAPPTPPSSDSNGSNRQNSGERREGRPHVPESFERGWRQKGQRKDFAWFMSSLG